MIGNVNLKAVWSKIWMIFIGFVAGLFLTRQPISIQTAARDDDLV
jgi:hypothetical protein